MEPMSKDQDHLNDSDVSFNVPIAKTDDDQRIAFGWASVSITKSGETVIDRQQDVIDSHDLEIAVYDYVENSRDAGEMHVRKGIGSLVESIVFTPEKIAALGLPEGSIPQGWWTGYRISDDTVWKGVKDGTYSMLSVHGVAKREPIL
ncbi:Phage-like element PBSX protein, XkdF [uncultured Caudovirales phage]|uniref:Phage-like element PBSX protein, XkdF n=1 Tax=uncultured Caudovirales phage TaxID=2100421 RepID=A0A6J5Q9C4_9CAUD|nr:Phage-like element PBSX protein, XkdF [uncultured Caudovirales phage]